MARDDLDSADPQRLARMLGLDPAGQDWRAQDWEAILRHQLSLRMRVDPGE